MIDLYKLPRGFRGETECRKITDPIRKVQCLETNFAANFNDLRFVPRIFSKPIARATLAPKTALSYSGIACHGWLLRLEALAELT